MSDYPPHSPPYATPQGYAPPFATPVPPRKSFGRGLFGWLLFIGLAAMALALLRREPGLGYDLSLADFDTELQSGNLRSVSIEGDELHGQFITPPPYANGAVNFRTAVPAGMASQWSFVQWVLANRHSAVVTANNNNNLVLQFILPLIPWLLIFLFVWFFIFRQLRAAKNQPQRPQPVIIVNPEQRG